MPASIIVNDRSFEIERQQTTGFAIKRLILDHGEFLSDFVLYAETRPSRLVTIRDGDHVDVAECSTFRLVAIGDVS